MLNEILTNDGTLTFFNEEIGECYHSACGAKKEAVEKYILPSFYFFQKYNQIKSQNSDFVQELFILDPFFGLGYNTLAACEFFISKGYRLNIIAIEKDQLILNQLKKIIKYFPHQENIIKSLIKKKEYCDNKTKIQLIVSPIEDFFLGSRNLKFNNKEITHYNNCVDFIFHDAFSTQKVPHLWTSNIFYWYKNILKEFGSITTYSNSIPMRAGLIENGFSVFQTQPVGRTKGGVIGIKKKKRTYTKEFIDCYHLSTGQVPFRYFPTKQEIFTYRHQEKLHLQKTNPDILSLKKYRKLML